MSVITSNILFLFIFNFCIIFLIGLLLEIYKKINKALSMRRHIFQSKTVNILMQIFITIVITICVMFLYRINILSYYIK